MSLSCAEFRARVWESLDAKSPRLPPETAAHAAACPACAAYTQDAARLERLLPEALLTEAAASVASSVLGRIRRERTREELPGYWVPVCVFSSLGAVAAAWYAGLWDTAAPYVTLDLSGLGSMLRWGESLASCSAPLRLSALAWTCVLAALLWLSAHRRLMKEEMP